MTQTLVTQSDAAHLERTLVLAELGQGQVSPNPLVGAVVVRDGRVLGEGFHAGPGHPHAEQVALDACTEDPEGATMFVSLEPCAHHGRTPPCAEAIVAAGIRRVVMASDDPSDRASGRGPDLLRAEGIEVDWAEPELAHAARLLNQPFRKHARTGRPLVVFKSALTLDGKVATRAGDSQWISSEESRARVHRLRGEVDAVAVGIGTVLADDPLLTARPDEGEPPRQPRRVVFDTRARLPLDSALVRSSAPGPIVVCAPGAPAAARHALAEAGAEMIEADGPDEPARIEAALAALGEREIQSLLLEGGPRLAGAFLDAGEIDAMTAFVAPLLAGGSEARSVLEGRGADSIAGTRRALTVEIERIGEDACISARFREW